MAGDNTMAENSIYAQLPPEALQQLMKLGGLEHKNRLLEQQMAEAMGLRNKRYPQAIGAGAGALYGLADVLNTVNSYKQQHELQTQESQNMAEQDAGRQIFGTALAREENPGYGYGQPLAESAPDNRIASNQQGGMVGQNPLQAQQLALAQALRRRTQNIPDALAMGGSPYFDAGGY